MIINESGMVRAIKQEWKTGYNVYNTGEEAIVYGASWFVRCEWKLLPRKALATIVEHMGMPPQAGEVVTVLKGGELQTVIADVVASDIECWTKDMKAIQVKPVPMEFNGDCIVQQCDGGKCYGVKGEYLNMVDNTFIQTQEAPLSGNRLNYQADGEMVVMAASRPERWEDDPWIGHIWKAMESVNLHRPI